MTTCQIWVHFPQITPWSTMMVFKTCFQWFTQSSSIESHLIYISKTWSSLQQKPPKMVWFTWHTFPRMPAPSLGFHQEAGDVPHEWEPGRGWRAWSTNMRLSFGPSSQRPRAWEKQAFLHGLARLSQLQLLSALHVSWIVLRAIVGEGYCIYGVLLIIIGKK